MTSTDRKSRRGHQPKDDPLTSTLLLTRRQAAQALAISERTLWTLTDSGEIPCVRLGKCVRYRISILGAYLEAIEEGGFV